MGRAEDLFERLSEEGEKAIDELILDRQSEELFLDFKRSADNGSGSKLHDNDRANLAKAISGFGNSEGGVIVWGVDCSRAPDIGDVASSKAPIQNPKRFLSWLEGTVSGCTVPPHSSIRHAVMESFTDKQVGFVSTYIPKSYLAPHQCLKPLQYYIRAGSDFVPTPHAVLMGLFGRRPQPFVFHMWSIPPARLVEKPGKRWAAEFDLGFMLGSHGPGVARDLYVNVQLIPSRGGSTAAIAIPNKVNWSGHHAFERITNIVSNDSFKLAPEAFVQPIIFKLSFMPPFESDLVYEITFGHQTSPVTKVNTRVKPEVLTQAHEALLKTGDSDEKTRRAFVETVMDLKDAEDRRKEIYRSL